MRDTSLLRVLQSNTPQILALEYPAELPLGTEFSPQWNPIEKIMESYNHRGDKGRGETEGVSLPFQLERTPQLGSWWLHWVHLLLCPSKIFWYGNKNTLSLVLVFSVIFNNVFKALNLFLNKYVAEIQLPGNGIWLLSIPQRFYTEIWHGLALAINITTFKEQSRQ
jgi:hypothetical protein